MRRRDALAALLLAGCAARPRASATAPATDAVMDADPQLLALLRGAGPVAKRVVAAAAEFELQILWTRCRRGESGAWQVVSQHSYGLRPQRWFAAASFIKLPLVAVLGEELCRRGLAERCADLSVRVDPSLSCAPLPEGIADGLPLLRLLRAMLVVSDNRAYNALYELIGSDVLHARLTELGYGDCRIGARLGCGASTKPGKLAAQLLDGRGKVQWDSRAERTERPQLFPFGAASKGRAWMQDGRQIAGPRDFRASNFMPLADVHRMTLELGSGGPMGDLPAFELCPPLRKLVAESMRMTPHQCPEPAYDSVEFTDDHSKWLLNVDSRGHFPDGVGIASKNAQAYGYLGDSAFIVDAPRDLAFGLSAVLFVDRDGVLNDGRYAYADIGRPFLRELGSAVLAYERGNPLTSGTQQPA